MSTYRKIHGRSIQAVTTDPSDSVAEGQIWYNTTSDTFKSVLVTEAWASASSLATARRTLGAAGNDRDASMAFGGGLGAPLSTSVSTEEYSGNGWSAGGNLNTSRYILDGAGTQTSGVAFGGATTPPFSNSASTEEYDGSSWTASNNLNTARYNLTGLGTQTAALAFGRDNPSDKGNTEEYNGTSWTAANPMNTGRYSAAGSGTQTAALGSGGYSTTFSNDVEDYDGTNWTTLSVNLGTARYTVSGSKGGTTSSALVFGGGIPPGSTKTVATEFFDGTSFTSKPNMATAVGQHGGVGTATSAMSFGGQTASAGDGTNATEEFTSSVNVITASAYSSLPNLNNARDPEGFGSKNGTTTSAYVGNGGIAGNGMSNYTEEFDGSSWTAGGNLPSSWRHSGGTGIQTAGLCVGGFNGPSNLNGVYHYNGSSWTSGGNYPVAQYAVSVAGTQTAAIGSGGGSDTTPANTYNGSSWTSAGNMSVGRSWFGSAGTTTASLAIGGANATTGQCEEYDGSSWTSGGSLTTGRTSVTTCAFGTQTAAGQCGANQPTNPSPGKINFLQTYDGTSWITGANMGTGRQNGSGSGTTTSHLIGSGFGPGTTYSVAAEEYTDGTTALNVKTLTQS